MIAPTPDVLLITDDAQLVRSVAQSKPAGAALQAHSTAEFSRKLPEHATADLWLDLEGVSATDLPTLSETLNTLDVRRRVYFHAASAPDSRTLPPALYIRKPVGPTLLHVLWSGVERGPLGEPVPVELPAITKLPLRFVEDFQTIDLAETCHALVAKLPGWLGMLCGTLYRTDPTARRLTLAESSATPVDLTVRLDDPKHPVAIASRERRILKYDDWNQACRQFGWVGGVPSDVSIGVIAPLLVGPNLIGCLQLSGRADARDASPIQPCDALFRFLARGLHHAARFAQTLNESRIDALTGLLNHRGLLETLQGEMGRAARFQSRLSMITLDLDGLKPLNDRLGHAAGDALLRHTAGKVRAMLRQVDAAARIGGDEFVVILPSTDGPGAMRVANRILEALRDDAAHIADERVPMTASIGVAEWAVGVDVDQLLRSADAALYEAKRQGRDRAVCSEAGVVA
ncbi:MAG: diguanylate cyclase [Phycisphaerae bacterium]